MRSKFASIAVMCVCALCAKCRAKLALALTVFVPANMMILIREHHRRSVSPLIMGHTQCVPKWRRGPAVILAHAHLDLSKNGTCFAYHMNGGPVPMCAFAISAIRYTFTDQLLNVPSQSHRCVAGSRALCLWGRFL